MISLLTSKRALDKLLPEALIGSSKRFRVPLKLLSLFAMLLYEHPEFYVHMNRVDSEKHGRDSGISPLGGHTTLGGPGGSCPTSRSP